MNSFQIGHMQPVAENQEAQRAESELSLMKPRLADLESGKPRNFKKQSQNIASFSQPCQEDLFNLFVY